MDSTTKMNQTDQDPKSVSGTQQDAALAASMERTAMGKKVNWFMVGVVSAVVFGLGTGYVTAVVTKPPEILELADSTNGKSASQDSGIKAGQVFGNKDTSNFKDSAEGVVLPGGVGNEGSHHLVRPGGASQNVYLTSSVVDLKLFENAKVKIFGETFTSKRAGWLMDVVRVEVIELNAPLPDWVVKEQAKATPKPATQD